MASPAPTDPAAIAQAWCCGRKLTATLGDAAPEVQLVILLLWIVTIAVVVVWVRGLMRRADGRTIRRRAWLGGWQVGGPLLAAAMTGYLAMNFSVALYAYPPATTADYAPGWAEMALVMWSGLLTGALATFARASLAVRAPD